MSTYVMQQTGFPVWSKLFASVKSNKQQNNSYSSAIQPVLCQIKVLGWILRLDRLEVFSVMAIVKMW